MSKKITEYPEFSKDIDDYISHFSPELQERMTCIRTLIHELVPQIREHLSYQMPAFYFHEDLVYFACYKNHIGFYPTSSGIIAFEEELTSFQWSKGAVQFPHKKELPVDLIRRMTEFRKNEVTAEF